LNERTADVLVDGREADYAELMGFPRLNPPTMK